MNFCISIGLFQIACGRHPYSGCCTKNQKFSQSKRLLSLNFREKQTQETNKQTKTKQNKQTNQKTNKQTKKQKTKNKKPDEMFSGIPDFEALTSSMGEDTIYVH